MKKNKVLLHCVDVVGKAMAGPAIRYWEMAKALSCNHDVTMICPNRPEITSHEFSIISTKDQSLRNLASNFDVIITQYINPIHLMMIKQSKTKIILDLYDPVPLEALETDKNETLKRRQSKNSHNINRINCTVPMADGILCANKQQKHFWTGLLMSQNWITPQRYDLNHTFSEFIKIVPFGLPSETPRRNGKGLRKIYGFTQNDTVLLWGGGIWNWFDPLTLIEAMAKLSKDRNDIKLVFMGLKHPNDSIPAMSMSSKALDLSKQLGLFDKNVFFNFGWVPYEERTNFLLDADIGMSIHAKHLETTYAFRTRILDYLWAELPVITTEGDSFADLVEEKNLGIVVPFYDSNVLAQAIEKLADDKETTKQIKVNLNNVKQSFYWNQVTQPLEEMIQYLAAVPHTKLSFSKRFNIGWNFAKSYLAVKS